MDLRDRMLRLAKAPHLPRHTVRLRLMLLYGALFLVSGAALLTITYFFLDAATGNAFIVHNTNGTTIAGFDIGSAPPNTGVGPVSVQQNTSGHGAGSLGTGSAQSVGGHAPSKNKGANGSAGGEELTGAGGSGKHSGLTPKQLQEQSQEFTALAYAYRDRERRQLLVESGIALAIMAVVSVFLGWLVAGRVLRPLRTITATTREISASNLHERLDLRGPDDELKELGDTIDGLLGRLDAAFRSQRQFVANASHELRTPLARQRTLAQVALSDPDATAESLRAAHERILVSGEQQEQLIDALLTLSRVQAGAVARQRVDLAPIVRDLLAARADEADTRQVRVVPSLVAAPLRGDPRLVERLAANLIDNAMRHNEPGGMVVVQTGTRAGHGWLAVFNDGPDVAPEEIERLYEPFERMGAERTHAGQGFGLGLCIVRAVATAHGASLTTEARPNGGLHVEVRFPPIGEAAPGGGDDGAECREPGASDEVTPAGNGPAESRGDLSEGRKRALVHASRSGH
jgi:signal transduction histidine kinase